MLIIDTTARFACKVPHSLSLGLYYHLLSKPELELVALLFRAPLTCGLVMNSDLRHDASRVEPQTPLRRETEAHTGFCDCCLLGFKAESVGSATVAPCYYFDEQKV